MLTTRTGMSIPCPGRASMCPGRRIFLPVIHEEARPFTGDVHVDAVLRAFILPPESDPDAFYHTINSMASEADRFFALLSAVSIRLFDQLTYRLPAISSCGIIPLLTRYPSFCRCSVNVVLLRKKKGLLTHPRLWYSSPPVPRILRWNT